MSTMAGSSLSDLPDDLLQRILYFVPAKEAASTAVLSRRWRSLLPTPWCGAGVHFDTRTVAGGDSFDERRDAFFQGAKAALAEHGSVRRLTIHVEEKKSYEIRRFMFRDRYAKNGHDIVDDVLSQPASHGVEELRIEAYTSGCPAAGNKCYGSYMPNTSVGYYDLSFGSIPSQALRDLQITNCDYLEPPASAASFPCLAVLRLQSCVVPLDSLQDMISASPQLDTLHLNYVFIYHFGPPLPQIESLCCPKVTTLMLVNCRYDEGDFISIELDAPRMRHFRYSGNLDMFPLKSPPPDLTRVDLHIFDTRRKCTLFWQFLMNFRSTEALKLKLKCPIEDIAVAEKERHDELLGGMLFGNFEHLEVDVKHKPAAASKNDVAVAIGNLLQCCPAVVDLRLKLNTADDQPNRIFLNLDLNRKAQLDFQKSINHFMRRKDQVFSFGGDDEMDVVSDIPGLSDKLFNFNCLRFYLKRVSLQFCLEKSNGFGVQLAKFFFEKAMVLEEMYIDDGNHKMCEHVNRKLGGRSTNPLQPCSEYKVFSGISQEVGVKGFISCSKIRERLPNTSKHHVRRRNSWSSGFIILPLER